LKADPWIDVATKYPVGSKHTATVKNFQNFGVFVELEEGIDGLVHISDLSWSKKIKHPSEFTKVGEKMDVVVLEVDPENRRLSLGHKQLEENPWDVFESIFTEAAVATEKKAANDDAKKAVKKVKDSVEKTTLGDMDVLSNLKANMEESEKNAKK
jgi:small subunit ribosomal protein S1